MNEFRMSLLKERADAIRPDLTKAREITEAAEREHRDLTDEEKAFTEPTIRTAREIADGMQKVRDDDAMMTAIRSEFGDVLGPLGASPTEAKSRRLSFKGLGTKVATMMLGTDGQKALARSGATIVGQEFVRDPVALGQVAQSLLDVLPVKAHTSTEYAYLRQTVRTNAAAVVAVGATKPTSVYTINKVPNTLAVVALLSKHLSLSLLAAHGSEAPKALLQRTILDAGGGAECGQ